MRLTKNESTRFWAKVDKQNCWLWTGGLCQGGYGQCYHRGKRYMAHRFSYELFKGPIPIGLQLDHLCRVRRCIKPDHLEPVTRKTNITRGISRGKRERECSSL